MNELPTTRCSSSHSLLSTSQSIILSTVDPATGVHTQNIKSYWNKVKTKFKRMKGVHASMLTSHLGEFMWCERYRCTATAALNSLLRDIASSV